MSFVSINPSTGVVLAQYESHTDQEVHTILHNTYSAQHLWRELSVDERSSYVNALAKELRNNSHTLAELCSTEMGKPITQAKGEIEKSASTCEYYAQNATLFLSNQLQNSSVGSKRYVCFDPLGVILGIMPWNFPVWQVIRAVVPAILAGNTIVIKHSPEVQGTALLLQEIFNASLPPHVCEWIRVETSRIPAIIADSRIAAVTLTGSTNAGLAVAAECAKYCKKSVLELGGSDPYIILNDASIEKAAQTCATSRMLNNGQSCVAAKRFVVHKEIAQQFTEAFVHFIKQYVPQNPLDASTILGPLARVDLRDTLQRQVDESIKVGATILLEGGATNANGAWFNPVVLGKVQKGMPAYHQELFGPVAAIITVDSEEEAIAVANDSQYGLGAAIFSDNTARAERLARRIEAGMVFINDFVSSNAALPFGGIKLSGWGRELSEFGIREFVNVKSVVVA